LPSSGVLTFDICILSFDLRVLRALCSSLALWASAPGDGRGWKPGRSDQQRPHRLQSPIEGVKDQAEDFEGDCSLQRFVVGYV